MESRAPCGKRTPPRGVANWPNTRRSIGRDRYGAKVARQNGMPGDDGAAGCRPHPGGSEPPRPRVPGPAKPPMYVTRTPPISNRRGCGEPESEGAGGDVGQAGSAADEQARDPDAELVDEVVLVGARARRPHVVGSLEGHGGGELRILFIRSAIAPVRGCQAPQGPDRSSGRGGGHRRRPQRGERSHHDPAHGDRPVAADSTP